MMVMEMHMEVLGNVVCSMCGVAGHVSRVSKREMDTVRGRQYEVDKVIRRCGSCGGEFENTQDEDWRLGVYARYRADMGMVTPEAMVAFRKEHGLSQEDMTALLKWRENTLGRYERGSLQCADHDKVLVMLMSPGAIEARRFDDAELLRQYLNAHYDTANSSEMFSDQRGLMRREGALKAEIMLRMTESPFSS